MSKSRGVGRFGGRLWLWTISVLAAGLLVAVIVYAANPDGDVSISARNDQWGTSGVTDVWGLGETIRYRAACCPCECPHNCHFTGDGGLTTHVENNPDVVDSIYGSKASTGSYNLAAKCPDDGSHGAPTHAFKVVDTTHLQVDGQNVEGTTKYYAKAASGSITITATLDPSVSVGDLRSGFMVWSGGASGADQLQRTVSQTSAGSTTVTCKAGPNGTQKSVTICVVTVDKLQYKIDSNSEWQDAPTPPDKLVVGKTSTVFFKAIIEPSDASSWSWPDGKPVWEEAAGSGTYATAICDTASSSTNDPLVVTVECGNSPPISAHIVVVDIAQFAVNANRVSAPTESSFPMKEGEHFEVGGTFDHELVMGSWPEPHGLRYEIWDLDLIDERVASGPGKKLDDYTWTSGTLEGDCRLKWFVDKDADQWSDSGEHFKNAPDFWVQQIKAFSFNVEYSNAIPGSNATIESTIRDAFSDAETRVLRKDTASDCRSCVSFTLNSLSEFNYGADRPDPVNASEPWPYTNLNKHWDACTVTFVDTLYNAAGVTKAVGTMKIIIDYTYASGDTVAHEVGHGAGITGDYQPPSHSGTNIMYYQLGGAMNELYKDDSGEYDD